MRQASILHRASSRDMNQFSFRHSCRSLPLNDSTVALSVGVPGREKSIRIPRLYTHLSSIFPANSEPLSVFSNSGKGRLSAMVFNISATSVERRFWPTQIPRHSRVSGSSRFKRRTLVSRSCSLKPCWIRRRFRWLWAESSDDRPEAGSRGGHV